MWLCLVRVGLPLDGARVVGTGQLKDMAMNRESFKTRQAPDMQFEHLTSSGTKLGRATHGHGSRRLHKTSTRPSVDQAPSSALGPGHDNSGPPIPALLKLQTHPFRDPTRGGGHR